MNPTDCWTCRSVSGEKRISPGPIIYEGEHWMVEHAYPTRLVGWLVLVLKRHAEALHELSTGEFEELARLQALVARALAAETGCVKEYAMCFAEAEHFRHVHVHLVPRAPDLPEEFRGGRIFGLLNVDEREAVPAAEVTAFCEAIARRLGAARGAVSFPQVSAS